MTWKSFPNLSSQEVQGIPAKHRGSWQKGQEVSSLQRRGGHKTLLAVSVLAPGIPALPIKLWGSCGCNEVLGTEVAITAQLNCHQHLMEVQRPNPDWTQAFTNPFRSSDTFPACRILNENCRCVGCVTHPLYLQSHIYTRTSPDPSDTNFCGAKATIPTPLQRVERQIFQTSECHHSVAPKVCGCRYDTQIRCQTVSEYFTWILRRNRVPVLVNVKKRKKKSCAFEQLTKCHFLCTTVGKTQCPLACRVEKSFEYQVIFCSPKYSGQAVCHQLLSVSSC